ncbi:MAG: FecR family protein [Balneolaceae bacterium]
MKTQYKPILISVKCLICLVCIGMVWTEIEDIYEGNELGLIRRSVPSVFISNAQVDTAEVGTSLFSGDTLQTNQDGYAMILFMDESITRVRPESQLIIRGEVRRDRSSSSNISVETGEIFMNINPDAGSDVEIGTYNSVAAVKGTIFGSRSTGYYWVEEGEVEVVARESGMTVTITGGMYAKVDEDGEGIETGTLNSEEIAELSEDYKILDSDLIERTLKLRFRDENGQLREIEMDYIEQND